MPSRTMQYPTLLFAVLALLLSASPAEAQPSDRHLDIEVKPVAYILGGAGGHVGYQVNSWNYTLEIFGLEVPQSLHGNEGFEAAPLGAEIHIKRFFGGDSEGFYAGPEVGISRLKVTHQASGQTERHIRYSVGVRGGYRWYPGLGDLYLSPVIGLTYGLNGEAIDIENETFETGPVTPFATVGIGWSL